MSTLTIAQEVRQSANPYLAAIAKHSMRGQKDSVDHLTDKKIFHFEDGSFLTFEVSYTAVEDGAP